MKIKNILMSVVSVMAVAASAQSSEEQAVWSKVESLNTAAFVSKDRAVLASLVDAKVSYSHSNGKTESKAEMLDNAVASKTLYRDLKTERVGINIVQNTAIVRHLLSATQTDTDGKESPLRLGVLQVWLKTGAQWELGGRQAVRLPPL